MKYEINPCERCPLKGGYGGEYRCSICELTFLRKENERLNKKLEKKRKYYAIVGYRNCYGKFSWHIEYVSIEYEKEHNQVAIMVNGNLFVTSKDLLFKVKSEAEAKLKELKGEADHK